MYFIKEEYKCNSSIKGEPTPYEETVFNSIHYQTEVYKFAAKIIREYGLKSILDIGCGYGLKLIQYIYPICSNISGIDLKYSIDFCKKYLYFATVDWIEDNIERPSVSIDKKFDLIVASDIIEHLINPDNLFRYIRKYSYSNTYIIMSTPERDKIRGSDDVGPSPNKSHIREWNNIEFEQYIRESNFTVIESFLAKSIYFSDIKSCQIFLIRGNIKNE